MADIILIIVLLLFVYMGYRNGFVKTFINALANIVSVIFSIIFTNPVAKIICESPLGIILRDGAVSYVSAGVKDSKLTQAAVEMAADGICMTLSSIISFILIALVVKIAVRIIAGAMGLVSGLPLIKQVNRVLGAAIGAVSGFLICYVVIGFIIALSHGTAMELDLVIQSIENSFICSAFYHNNIVGNAICSVI